MGFFLIFSEIYVPLYTFEKTVKFQVKGYLSQLVPLHSNSHELLKREVLSWMEFGILILRVAHSW